MNEKLLLGIPKAADFLDIGETLFRDEVLPYLSVIEIRSRRLVSVAELEQWVDDRLLVSSPSSGSGESDASTVAQRRAARLIAKHGRVKP